MVHLYVVLDSLLNKIVEIVKTFTSVLSLKGRNFFSTHHVSKCVCDEVSLNRKSELGVLQKGKLKSHCVVFMGVEGAFPAQ